jgi:glycosyltransferase involved in cell wall biosynthesis
MRSGACSEMSPGCRVLVLNERDPLHPAAGGAEVHVAEICSRLASQGFELTLASSGFRGAPAREVVRGLEIWRLGPLPAYYPRAAWLCARETRRGRFDLIVEHLNKLPFFSPVLSTVPVVAVCHHLFGFSAFLQVAWPIAAAVVAAEKLIPPCYRGCAFVAVSESTRQDLAARGIPHERISVVHNGIRRPQLALEPPSRRGPRVAYLGRLEPYKRVDVMLAAVKTLVPLFPDLEVVIVGRGRDRSKLERAALRLGIAERTRFHGFVSDGERDSLLATARVCVCPSVKEGWGITVIEANASGVPVVATDAPGLRDAVRDGETGFLAPEGDVAVFAERIGRLLADDILADRMSRAGLAWSQHFDWDSAARAMAAVLESARAQT